MEQTKRVLVVEDDLHIADLICLHLRDEQFEVVHSADLIALDAVEEGGIFRRMWDSIRLFFYGLFN